MNTVLLTVMLFGHSAVPGSLMPVGGGKTQPETVHRFQKLIGGRDQKIVVFSQVHEETVESGQGSVDLLKENGCTNVVLISNSHIDSKAWDRIRKETKNAKGIWIPGGNQNYFLERFGTFRARSFFKGLLDNGCSFFGTSAGAMLMSDWMIGGPDEAGVVETRDGLGLTSWTIDSHYRERDRQERLRQALGRKQRTDGIGLSEGEWVILQNSKIIESHGNPEIIRWNASSTVELIFLPVSKLRAAQ